MNTALVTGAGTGLGRATAVSLAARGLHVLCVGRTEDTLAATLAQVLAAGGSGECIIADCGAHAGLAAVAATVGARSDNAGVVFVGSVSARHGRDRHAGYGASKAALIGLTVNLAAELAPRIRVNCVSPGATRTAMLKSFIADSTRGLSEQQRADVRISDAARMLLGRVANPAEVAASIIHLALDATATTGVDLPVDVGYMAS